MAKTPDPGRLPSSACIDRFCQSAALAPPPSAVDVEKLSPFADGESNGSLGV